MGLTSAKFPQHILYELSAAGEHQIEEWALNLIDLLILRHSPISSLFYVK